MRYRQTPPRPRANAKTPGADRATCRSPPLAECPPHAMHPPGIADQIMAVRGKDDAPGDADMAYRARTCPAANAVMPVKPPLFRTANKLPPAFEVAPCEGMLIHRRVTRRSPPGVSTIRVFERFESFAVEIHIQRTAANVGKFRAAILRR